MLNSNFDVFLLTNFEPEFWIFNLHFDFELMVDDFDSKLFDISFVGSESELQTS